MSDRYILVHHGIKGQRWGVRNGPPYPLGESDKSAAEKRASKTTPSKKDESASPGRSKFWTDERKATAKKVAKGVAITAAVVLAAYGGYKLSQMPAVQEKLGRKAVEELLGADDNGISNTSSTSLHGSRIVDLAPVDGSHASKEFSRLSGIPIKHKAYSAMEDLYECNSSWHDGSARTGNCPASVVAFAMRRGGYDADARPNLNPIDPRTGMQREMFSLDEADRYFRTAFPCDDARTGWRSSETLAQANERAFAAMERTIVRKYKEGSVVMIETSRIPAPDKSHESTYRHAIAGIISNGRLVIANTQEGERRIHIEDHLFGDDASFSLCGTGSSGFGGRYCLLDPSEAIPETIGEILRAR